MYYKVIRSVSDVESGPENCSFCQRPKGVVECGDCGQAMIFMRVRRYCPNHPRNLFVMDLSNCPLCKSENISEMQKYGWYKTASVADGGTSSRDVNGNRAFENEGQPTEREIEVIPGENSVIGINGENNPDTQMVDTTEMMGPGVSMSSQSSTFSDLAAPAPAPQIFEKKYCTCVRTAAWTSCHNCATLKRNVVVSVQCDTHPGMFTAGLEKCDSCSVDEVQFTRFDVN